MAQSLMRNIALALFGALFACSVAEVSLRAWSALGHAATDVPLEAQLSAARTSSIDPKHPLTLGEIIRPSRSPDIVYELKPNLVGNFIGVEIAINSHGMRSREISQPKPNNVKRIVGIGDSVMFGWGVPIDDTYITRTEQALNSTPAGDLRYEILNFAVPGYNTFMEVATLAEKALAFSPDTVVLHFVNNDWGVPMFMQSAPSIFSMRHLFLADFVRQRITAIDHTAPVVEFTSRNDESVERARAEYQRMVGARGFRSAMRRLADLSQQNHFNVIVLFGSALSEQRALLRQARDDFGFKLVSVKPFVDRYFANRTKSLGRVEDAAARRKAITLSAADPHPNAAGHQIYSDTLLSALRGEHVEIPAEQQRPRKRRSQKSSVTEPL